jgi:hypothetical protein
VALQKAAKAAPAVTGGDLRSFARFGGPLNLYATTKTSLQLQYPALRIQTRLVWILARNPERKFRGVGKASATATGLVGNGDDDTSWKVLTFFKTAAEELLSLDDGDALAATGSFRTEVYDRGAGPKVGLTLFADRLISAKRQKGEREKERRADQGQDPVNGVEAQNPLAGFYDPVLP